MYTHSAKILSQIGAHHMREKEAMSTDCCRGIPTLDYGECIAISANNEWAIDRSNKSFPHCMDDESKCLSTMLSQQFRYRDENNVLTLLDLEQLQKLLKCIYTWRIIFQTKRLLSNYPFYGYSNESIPLFPSSKSLNIETKLDLGYIHDSLEIRFVRTINGLGLYSHKDIDENTFLGEYTGVVMENISASHDPYGVSYPCVYESNAIHLSANTYGNVMRCINHHPTKFNAKFKNVIHRGLLRVCVFSIAPIRSDEQVFVDYGKSYWQNSNIKPQIAL